jgi:uroporphyrinogen-III synthase
VAQALIDAIDRPATALAGRHIVITRPLAQAGHLAEQLAELGATPVRFPVLAIFDIEDKRPVLDAAIRLETYDLVVFVSPNAVNKALDVMLQHRQWPVAVAAATLGRSSERELARRGVKDIISPQLRFDSEALLEAPELQQMTGKRVLICRGDGGRELLGDTLISRGATVEYLMVYRRGLPTLDPAPLLKLWEAHQLDAVTLTSSEGLRNMIGMIGHLGHAWLKNTPTFVPHARIAEQAHQFGLRRIIPTGPGDDGLISGLLAYFDSDGKHSEPASPV